MIKLKGYINIFKRKTGFAIPVFLNLKKELIIQEGDRFVSPEDIYLSKKEGFFFNLKSERKIDYNPSENHLSFFIYNQGNSLIYMWDDVSDELEKIPKNELNPKELSELTSVLFEKQLSHSFNVFENLLFSSDFNNIVNQVDYPNYSKLPCFELINNRFYDIDVFSLWKKNQDIFEKRYDDKNVLSALSYFLRFQSLSNSEINQLFSNTFHFDLYKGDSDICLQLYYLTIKNCNYNHLSKLLYADFINNSTNGLVLKRVFNGFEELKKKGNVNVKFSIAYLLSAIQDFVKLERIPQVDQVIKSKLEFVRNSLPKPLFKEEIDKIETEILPCLSIDVDELLNVYISNMRQKGIGKNYPKKSRKKELA